MNKPELLEHWYKTTDWVLDKCDRFPKQTRFTLAGRIATIALETLELITEATYSKEKRGLLTRINLCFEKVFIADSFATRKDKGVHAAVFRAQYFLRGHVFFLKTDVEKFFDSVHHDTLLGILARKIKDKAVMAVCEKIIRHGSATDRGLPIGNRTSQFFANVYLDPLDHFMKDHLRVRGYVRYMDDFVVFENDKNQLKSLKIATEDFLQEKLRLHLKPSSTFLNRPENGLSFLGRRIFPNAIRLRNENLRRITRRIALRERDLVRGDLDEASFLHSMNSYWAMLSYYPSLDPLRQAILKK